MKYIFSLLSFYLFSFMLVFDSMAGLDRSEEFPLRVKRVLTQLNQEDPSRPPCKKTRLIENEISPELESNGSLSEAVVAHFAMCLSPCTEVLEDLNDEAPSLSTPPARYNPFARLNAIAAIKLQENIYSDEGFVRQKWHRNIYRSTSMLPENNG